MTQYIALPGPIPMQRKTPKAKLPTVATDGSAGMDLYTCEGFRLEPGEQIKAPTGIAPAIPLGWVGQVWPRSGMAAKQGGDTGAGVIDPDFRGEMEVVLYNRGKEAIEVEAGERVGQLLVVPNINEIVEVDELPETNRGAQGFGHSGR